MEISKKQKDHSTFPTPRLDLGLGKAEWKPLENLETGEDTFRPSQASQQFFTDDSEEIPTSISQLMQAFQKRAGVLGNPLALDAEILEALQKCEHLYNRHIPGGPLAGNVALLSKIGRGSVTASRFDSKESAIAAVREAIPAILKKVESDPRLFRELREFLFGNRKRIGISFRPSRVNGWGYRWRNEGWVEEIDDFDEVYAVFVEGDRNTIQLLTLYPVVSDHES